MLALLGLHSNCSLLCLTAACYNREMHFKSVWDTKESNPESNLDFADGIVSVRSLLQNEFQ